ncbi:MAG: metalloregulator ArsR/SmtB family transcription factor [Pseudomonadales bacterium]|nr:metalloregulator ArsR/SmtB family transcription factor [Pseudomonadales bacterium]
MALTARIDDAPARGIAAPAGIDQLVALGKAVGDVLRAGVLQVLHEDSYSVTELCELFQVPQPALSHHLKILHGAGLLAKRREGNSIFYRRASAADSALRQALFGALDQTRLPAEVAQRIRAIHAARRKRSEEFFAQNATDIASEQAQICESAVYTETISELICELLAAGLPAEHALEVGPGDGHLLRWLAGTFERVTGLDSSERMLEAARAGTRGIANLRLSHRDFHEQADQRRYQLIVAAMVVHHQASPSGFFQKAARILKSGGALIVAELCSHDQQWASDACGDLWLGFDTADLTQWAETAGLICSHSQYLAQKNGFRIQVQCYRLPAN